MTETFIERINKSAVDTGDGSPKIIGSDLVILEFKDFIRKLKEGAKLWHGTQLDNWLNEIDKLAGSVNVAQSEPRETPKFKVSESHKNLTSDKIKQELDKDYALSKEGEKDGK